MILILSNQREYISDVSLTLLGLGRGVYTFRRNFFAHIHSFIGKELLMPAKPASTLGHTI